MSNATKGKALLAILLFVGLFAAVTFLPVGGAEAPDASAGGGERPSPRNEAGATGAAPAPEDDEGPQTAGAGRAEDAAGTRDPSDDGEAAQNPPAEPEENAQTVSDRRPAPASDGPAGALSSVDRGRAEQAASQFVVYAYGYTGDDVEQYRSYVNQAVVPESFAKSPGAATVEDFARKIEATGTESSVVPKSVELTPAGDGSATADVTFELTDPSGRSLVSQSLRVVPLGDVWRVAEAGELREAAP